jgi:hypothetical protein
MNSLQSTVRKTKYILTVSYGAAVLNEHATGNATDIIFEWMHQILEPVLGDHAIVVQKGDDVVRGMLDSDISCIPPTPVFPRDKDVLYAINGAMFISFFDQNNLQFVFGIVQSSE